VIFYLAAYERALRDGVTGTAAAVRATLEVTPIVAVAGLTVAAGTASLLVARSGLFRAFGPGMAMAVLIGLAVTVTLVPGVLAVLGRWVLWPRTTFTPRVDMTRRVRRRLPVRLPLRLPAAVPEGRLIDLLTRRGPAAVLLVACLAGLALAALPLRNLELGLSFVPSLPVSDPVREAAREAKAGFSDGILSPTVLLVEDEGITSRRAELERLGRLLAAQPGVSGVVGPGEQVLPTELGIVLARNGAAARFLIVLADEPLGARAIGSLRALEDRLDGLLDDAGLSDVRYGLGGDTAIISAAVQQSQDDLGRIALAAVLVNLLLLVLFLRSLVAPLYLLASTLLALAATLGLTTFVFQSLLGQDSLTFYVPFAAAVLLVALGSDYNILGVGSVWELDRRRPLREALRTAVPESTRAITAAGVTLATSFGLLALVPLQPFRELAFAMAVGILLDVLVVRSLLVPALLTVVGRVSGWPGTRLIE